VLGPLLSLAMHQVTFRSTPFPSLHAAVPPEITTLSFEFVPGPHSMFLRPPGHHYFFIWILLCWVFFFFVLCLGSGRYVTRKESLALVSLISSDPFFLNLSIPSFSSERPANPACFNGFFQLCCLGLTTMYPPFFLLSHKTFQNFFGPSFSGFCRGDDWKLRSVTVSLLFLNSCFLTGSVSLIGQNCRWGQPRKLLPLVFFCFSGVFFRYRGGAASFSEGV